MESKWEPHKEKIKALYMDQRLPLVKVMKVMESDGFYASKQAYQMQLRRWGFKKNCKHAELKIVKARYANAVQHKVKFDIRFGGNQLDEKKLNRCLIPVSEKYKLERSSLPDKWAITPRVSELYLSSVTTSLLPFEYFQIQFDSFLNAGGFIDMPLQMGNLVISTFRSGASSRLCEHHAMLSGEIFHSFSAVLPVAEDAEIFNLLWQIMPWDSSSATAQFLKLAIYFLSNKLFGTNLQTFCQVNDELLKWFKMGNNHRILRAILLARTPTIDALAEGLFCSALRAEDMAFSRLFLEFGLNPDITFKYQNQKSLFIHYTPLKLMVQRGNICLIRLLFEFHANANAMADMDRSTALLLAVKTGNLEIARLLISKGAFVNGCTYLWKTPLQAALRAGDIGMVRELLAAGADVNLYLEQEGLFAECPLWHAITSGVTTLVDMLLERGAKLDPLDAKRVGTPLQRAIQMENETETRRLLQLGADVNAPAGDWDGRTALQAAAEKGDLALCQVLIQAGADVNAAPASAFVPHFSPNFRTKGVTALVAAMDSKNHQLVKVLVDSGVDVNATISEQLHPTKRTALTLTVSLNDVEMVQYLICAGADAGRDDSIYYAVGERGAELIPILVAAGANINHQDHDLLYEAAMKEDLDLIQLLLDWGARPGPRCLPKAAEQGNHRMVQLLIEAGATIHPASKGKNALQVAALKGHVDIVTYLLDQGADVNRRGGSAEEFTTLQAAVESGDMDLIKLLITRGVDVNARASRLGATALQVAVKKNNKPLVRLLLEAGANANDEPAEYLGESSLQRAAANGADDLIHILLDHGSSINGPVARKGGRTALQAAVKYGHYRTVQLLLAKGAHVNAPASVGDRFWLTGTALQIAATMGYVRIAKVLIDEKADIDAPRAERWGGTALQRAAEFGRIDMLKLLLNAGANITTGDQLQIALTRATKNGHDAVAKFLECHQISRGI